MRNFWIDTDTASDDAVAILMALRWPDVNVLGISSVRLIRHSLASVLILISLYIISTFLF